MKKFLFMFITIFVFLPLSLALADVPMLLNYQGYVEDGGGPINGNGYFKFAIVNQAGNTTYWSNNGTSTAGSEPDAAVTIPVTNGVFTVKLGDAITFANMDVLPTTPFDQQNIYVRVWFSVDNVTFEQLTPDIQIVSAGFAYKAQSVVGGTSGPISWLDLTDIPADIADGDDGITSETDPTITENSIKDGVSWSELSDIPADFADGVDNVGTVGSVSWAEITGIPADIADGDDGITSETDPVFGVSAAAGITGTNITDWNTVSWSEITSRPAGLDDGDQVGITSESDPTVPSSVKDGISWTEVSSRPAGLDDGDQVGITNVVAGNGLTGGGTSATVTLDVGAGTGISVASNTVSVAPPLSLSASSSSAILQGTNSGSGDGVYGSSYTGYGVYGYSSHTDGYGGYFNGAQDHHDLVLGGSIGRINTDNSNLSSDMIISSNDDIQVRLDNDSGEEGIFYIVNSGGSTLFYVNETPNIGIGTGAPTQTLDVVGNARFRSIGTATGSNTLGVTSDGTLTTGGISDSRLKTNIENIEDGLEIVKKLQGVRFNWKEDPVGEPRIGLIAQDAEKVIPELTFTNHVDGYKGVNYAEITAVLIEAVKEQQETIEELGARLDELEKSKKAEIESLKNQLTHLRALVETFMAQQTESKDNKSLLSFSKTPGKGTLGTSLTN